MTARFYKTCNLCDESVHSGFKCSCGGNPWCIEDKDKEPKQTSREDLFKIVVPETATNPDLIMLSNIRDKTGIKIEWLQIWSEVENWYGDIAKAETGEQFLKRLQQNYFITSFRITAQEIEENERLRSERDKERYIHELNKELERVRLFCGELKTESEGLRKENEDLRDTNKTLMERYDLRCRTHKMFADMYEAEVKKTSDLQSTIDRMKQDHARELESMKSEMVVSKSINK